MQPETNPIDPFHINVAVDHPDWISELTCEGRDGITRTFWFNFEVNEFERDEIIFRVHKSNPPNMRKDHWFDMSLKKRANGSWKIISIGDFERRDHYHAMGIPDAMIPEAARLLQSPISSSSNKHPEEDNEFRTEPADHMWKRLVIKGLARYVPEEDRYFSIAP